MLSEKKQARQKAEKRRDRRSRKVIAICKKSSRYRLAVTRSCKNFSVQMIDVFSNQTFMSASTCEIKDLSKSSSNKVGASSVGALLSKKLSEKYPGEKFYVALDVGANKYGGVMESFVESAKADNCVIF